MAGVLAIVRLREQPAADGILEALLGGGVTQVEITLPTPHAEQAIARWAERREAVVGAGTVRTVTDVHRAADAGAQFLVTPTVSVPVLHAARERDVPVICGAATPTEIELAWTSGAAAVKVFPAAALGGPQYIRAVREPLDDVPLVATGGVGVAETAAYAAAGCLGVGVGGRLVSEDLVAQQAWAELTTRAAAFVSAWDGGREERT